MIKEIFLPEQIGTKRVYSQRILGFLIQNQLITCVQVYATRSKTFVEKLLKQELSFSETENRQEQIVSALKQILSKVDKFDQVKIAIPASLVVFTELKVPFKEPNKIRMILDYEIESQLPFNIEDAVVDYIITKESNLKEESSQILVAAARTSDVKNILDIYNLAGINPDVITIDLFGVYSLYQQISDYKNFKNATAFVDLGGSSTLIAFLFNGELRLTRTLSKGFLNIFKNISQEISLPIQEVQEKLMSDGLNSKNNPVFEKHLINFFNEIQFSLNSFNMQLEIEQPIDKILFTGQFSKLKGLQNFYQNLFQIPCESFDCEKLFSDKLFKNKVTEYHNDWFYYVATLGTALTSIKQADFNLRRKELELSYEKLTKKQLSWALAFIIIIFFTIFIKGYFTISSLSTQISNIEKEQINKIKKIFPPEEKLPQQIKLQDILNRAEKFINQKSELWKPFESQDLKILLVLQEMTNIIDKRKFDVNIEELIISKEENLTKVQVEGFFRSKTGSDHFQYFEELEKRFSESTVLTKWENEEIDAKLVEDKGIKFSAKLKLVEEE